MARVPFRKMRSDREIGNISDLPKEATEGRRSDMHIGTLLDEERVTSVEALKDKYKANKTLKKFNQKSF